MFRSLRPVGESVQEVTGSEGMQESMSLEGGNQAMIDTTAETLERLNVVQLPVNSPSAVTHLSPQEARDLTAELSKLRMAA